MKLLLKLTFYYSLFSMSQGLLFGQCIDSLAPISTAYFPFSNGIVDSSSISPNYTGTFNGQNTVDGIAENCLTFNGVDHYGVLNGNYNLDNDYTLATWLFPESSHYGTLFSQRAQCTSSNRGWGKVFWGISGDPTSNEQFPFFTNGLAAGALTVSNQIFVCLPRCAYNCNGYYNADIYTVPGIQIPIQCWSFVAIICTNNSSSNRNLKAFVNGELYDMTLVNTPPSSNTAPSPFGSISASYESMIGINHYNLSSTTNYPFHGRIDEFYLYDDALDECEIKAIQHNIIDIERINTCNSDTITYHVTNAQNLMVKVWLQNGAIVGTSDTLYLNAQNVGANDIISFVFQRANQCSTDTINMIPERIPNTLVQNDSFTICSSDSFLIFGTWTSTPGAYADTFTINGCDSIHNINLSVSDSIHTFQSRTFCDSVIFHGNVFYQDTIITNFYANPSGCDSILTTQLIKSDTFSFTTLYLQGCDSVSLSGITFYSDTIFHESYPSSINGCDSILSFDIAISTSVSVFDSVISCNPYTDILGVLHYKSDTVIYRFQRINGCDSVVTRSIEIRDSTDVSCPDNELDCVIEFPNVITPNSDGINDVFENVNKCALNLGSLHIFNRWGSEVFRSNPNSIEWDGYVEEQKAAQGVYFYIFRTNETQIKGSFSLL
jgi:gliding motility-associated-like protein